MVMRYPRLPALVILLIAVIWGGVYLVAARRAAARVSGQGMSLDELERAIKQGKSDLPTWSSFARKLTAAGQHGRAVQAWRKVLEFDPSNRDGRIGCAVALAQSDAAGHDEELLTYLRALVYSDAKMAVDLFDRGEIRSYLRDKRFAALLKDAQAQLMD